MDDDFKEENWYKIVEKLQKEYTISIKMVCDILECNRDWVNTYIRPNVECIQLTLKWATVYAGIRKTPDDRSAIWFSKTGFDEFLKNSVVKVQRRTRMVPIDQLVIDKSRIDDIRINQLELKSEIIKSKSDDDYRGAKKLQSELDDLIFSNCRPAARSLYNTSSMVVRERHRKACPPQDCPDDVTWPDVIYDWRSLHGMYPARQGNEMTYRMLFNEGAIKIVLNVHGYRVVRGTKQPMNGIKTFYYIPSEESSKLGYIKASEQVYQELKDQLYP